MNNTMLFLSGAIADTSGNGHTVTNTGVTLSAAQTKISEKSLYFDAGDCIDIPLSVASSANFTVDWWQYQYSNASSNVAFEWMNTSATTRGYYVHTIISGSNLTYLCATVNQEVATSGSQSALLNRWVHYAVVKDSKTMTLYINGAKTITFTLKTTIAPNMLRIGGLRTESFSATYVYSYIDAFRVSDIARWTANFTPPSKASDYGLMLPLHIKRNDEWKAVQRAYSKQNGAWVELAADELDAHIHAGQKIKVITL